MIDRLRFRSSKRHRVLAVAISKAFRQLKLLKQRNLDFMRGNHKNGDLKLNSLPKLIHVELSTACNIRCRFCSITRPGRHRELQFIDIATIVRLRPALAFISDCKLHGGGEPFLHPKIERILEIFMEEQVRLNTVTNANLITDRLGELIGQNFSTLTVSVDGADKETFEYVRLRREMGQALAWARCYQQISTQRF